MTRTLVLHAGLPKTGTTTIQNAFWRARETLRAEHGVCYPALEANHTNAVCTLFLDDPSRHITNRMAALRGDVDIAALQTDYRTKLEADLLDPGWQRALVSAEGISNLSADEIAKFRDWARGFADEIAVVFFVREPVSYVTSVVQQLLKGGETLQSMESSPPLPNFRGKISNAIAVFGREAVRVVPFEAAAADPEGLVAAFARAIGLSAEGARLVQSHATRDNESLSLQAALLLDALNTARPLFGETAGRRTGSETAHLEKVRGTRFRLPLAVRRAIHEASRPDVAWLNETFGLSLYGEPVAAAADEAATLPPESATSIALLVSNLLNTIEALSLTLQAREAQEKGDEGTARRKMVRAGSLAPDSAMVTRYMRRMKVAPE